jgi:hypothetical protein
MSMLGVALHLAMDFTTSYETRLLSPFDWTWYSLDWMPTIDIYLLVALGALVLAGRNPDSRRRAATIVLALMAANYVIRGVAHHEALAIPHLRAEEAVVAARDHVVAVLEHSHRVDFR